jgi:hypothetical protein
MNEPQAKEYNDLHFMNLNDLWAIPVNSPY